MESNQRERNGGVSIFSSSERILCNGHCIFAAWSTINPVGDPPIAPQSVEAAIEQIAAPILTVERKERRFNDRANRAVAEDRPASTIFPTQPRVGKTVHGHVASILALVEDTVIPLF